MKASTCTRVIATALLAAALASTAIAVPASAGTDGDEVVLRRDGSKATPFFAEVGPSASSERRSPKLRAKRSSRRSSAESIRPA